MGLLTCPRRVTALKGDEDSSDDARVGTVFHALAEQYYRDDMANVVVEFASLDEDPATVEGKRLFEAYREHFSNEEFGSVLACELQTPQGDEAHEIIKKAYGLPWAPTAKLDMVVELDADFASYISDSRNVEVEPGVYIIDHKTKKAHTSALIYEMQLRPQFVHYQNMWNLLNPDKPCKGLLANIVFRYKQVRDGMFLTIQVPPPTEEDVAMVYGIFRDAQRVLTERGTAWANPVHCFDFHRVCPLLTSGDCDRTNA